MLAVQLLDTLAELRQKSALASCSPSPADLTSEFALVPQACPNEFSKCIIGDLVTTDHVHLFGGSLDRALATTSCKRRVISCILAPQ